MCQETRLKEVESGGRVDYVLWGEDGKPLGVVEAKRTRRDAQAGQQQAKMYADCLEAATSIGLWDEAQYPPRQVSGFETRTELALPTQL